MELYAKVFEDMSHLNCMVYKREMRHGRVSLVRVDATYLPDIFWDAVNSKVEGYGRDRDGVVTFHHKRLSTILLSNFATLSPCTTFRMQI
jgi:hypothetical protein